jgi:AbrB family looped-hinge helix DNA binding protein
MTSKGQFTLPAEIRKQLNLQSGDVLSIDFSPKKREINLKKSMTIEEVHAMNQTALKRVGVSLKDYKSGDGFRQHVAKKYGTKKWG